MIMSMKKQRRRTGRIAVPKRLMAARKHAQEEKISLYLSTDLYERFKDKHDEANARNMKKGMEGRTTQGHLTIQDRIRLLIVDWVGDYRRKSHSLNRDIGMEANQKEVRGSNINLYVNPWVREEKKRNPGPKARGTSKKPEVE